MYKCEILPEVVLFKKEDVVEFVKGKRFKKLRHEMRKGMRTYNDHKKLAIKAEQRRARLAQQKATKKQVKRQKARQVAGEDGSEIERRRAKFQEKKARRMARKAATE